MTMIYHRQLLFLLILSLAGVRVGAQAPVEWPVPEAVKARVCPFRFTTETIKLGETLFQRNCKACHGDPGQNNWARMIPEPGDPAGERFQSQKDGEMFYRVTMGKAPMPSFKTTLTEQERWSVISYFRSFNKAYVQPDTALAKLFITKEEKLRIFADRKRMKVYVFCYEVMKDKQMKPLEGAEIQLTVKRYFGNLPVGNSAISDRRGFVMFDFPEGIRGNEYGVIGLVARVNDATGLLGEAEATINVRAGVPTHFVSLRADRAMWNTRDRAPVWIMLVFCISVVVVWGIIIYILLSIGKVRKLGSD
jgi:hypothetical protein